MLWGIIIMWALDWVKGKDPKRVLDGEDGARPEAGRLMWLKSLWGARPRVGGREGARWSPPWLQMTFWSCCIFEWLQ